MLNSFLPLWTWQLRCVIYSRILLCGLLRGLRFQTHGVHHPVSVNLYYEDQKAEALRAAEQFRSSRLLKFFQHFQSVLEANPANKDGKGIAFYFITIFETIDNVTDTDEGPFLLSNLTTAADLALFQGMTGVLHAFPRRTKSIQESGLRVSSSNAPYLTIYPNRQI